MIPAYVVSGICVLSVVGIGCIPMGYAATAAGLVAATPIAGDPIGEGGAVGGRLHISGSRGFTLAVEGEALHVGTAPCCVAWQAEAGAGYAFVPRPFESRLGYEGLVLAGVASPEPSDPARLEALATVRFALLVRLTGNDSVLHQDRRPSVPVWYLEPLLNVGPSLELQGGRPVVALDAAAGIGLRASFYDRTAP